LPRFARGKTAPIEPWYDYLAVPIAPLMLVAQIIALFLRRRGVRALALVGTPVLVAAMLAYVSSRPLRADEGANIGEGVLVLWLVVSVLISVVGLVAEGVRLALTRHRRGH
jgi:hypothetical protein